MFRRKCRVGDLFSDTNKRVGSQMKKTDPMFSQPCGKNINNEHCILNVFLSFYWQNLDLGITMNQLTLQCPFLFLTFFYSSPSCLTVESSSLTLFWKSLKHAITIHENGDYLEVLWISLKCSMSKVLRNSVPILQKYNRGIFIMFKC